MICVVLSEFVLLIGSLFELDVAVEILVAMIELKGGKLGILYFIN
jgi:hypothetical protein